jgi:hypothetical protein
MNDNPLTDKEKDAIRGVLALSQELRGVASFLKKPKRHRGPRTRLPRCPKCGQMPTCYVELWMNHTIHFSVDVNGIPEETGNLEPGDPYAVDAECGGCGKRWRLKGITNMGDLQGLV